MSNLIKQLRDVLFGYGLDSEQVSSCLAYELAVSASLKKLGVYDKLADNAFSERAKYCCENDPAFQNCEPLKNLAYLSNEGVYGSESEKCYNKVKVLISPASYDEIKETVVTNLEYFFDGGKFEEKYIDFTHADICLNWLTHGQKELSAIFPRNAAVNAEIEAFKYCNKIAINENNSKAITKKACLGTFVKDGCQTDYRLKSISENPDEKFDFGYTVPPFAAMVSGSKEYFEVIVSRYMSNCCKRFAVAFPGAFSFTPSKQHLELKKVLIDHIYAIIQLPKYFCAYSSINAVVMLCDMEHHHDNALLIDISSNDCLDPNANNRRQAHLAPSVKDEICKLLDKPQDSKYSKVVSKKESIENDYDLTPSKYIALFQDEELMSLQNEKTVKLSEIASIIRVQMLKKDLEGMDYFEVGAADINEFGFVRNPAKAVVVNEENPSLKYKLQKDDILFAIKGSVGKVGMVKEDHDNWIAGQTFVIIRAKNKEHQIYLFRELKSKLIQKLIGVKKAGNAIPFISVKDLNDLTIRMPSLESVNEANKLHEKQVKLFEQYESIKQELIELN